MFEFSQLGALGLKALIDAQETTEHRLMRRREYGRRVAIMADVYEWLALERILYIYTKSETHLALTAHLEAGRNVLTQTVRDLAFAFRRPPVRQLDIEGPVGEALNERFAEGLRESGIAKQARQWGEYAFAMNIVWVVPIVWRTAQGMRTEFQLVLPDLAARVHGADVNDTQILLWSRDRRDSTTGANAGQTLSGSLTGWVLVDSEAYYWLDPNYQIERVVPHGIGRIPAVPFRNADAPPRDFWDIGRGRQLVHATLESTRIGAAAAWIRTSQNRKIVTALGDIGTMDISQTARPEAAITAKTEDKDSILFEVHDYETAIGAFRDEERWVVDNALESVGIPKSANGEDDDHRDEARKLLREDQITFQRPADRELIEVTYQLMQSFGHPLAIAPGIIKENYQAIWSPASTVEDPMAAADLWQRRIALGLMDASMAAQELYPGMTRPQALRFVIGNRERQAELNKFYAEHNMAAEPWLVDDGRMLDVPQMQGRAGGMIGAARQGQPQPAA